jgi:hypothetical protein
VRSERIAIPWLLYLYLLLPTSNTTSCCFYFLYKFSKRNFLLKINHGVNVNCVSIFSEKTCLKRSVLTNQPGNSLQFVQNKDLWTGPHGKVLQTVQNIGWICECNPDSNILRNRNESHCTLNALYWMSRVFLCSVIS